MSEFKLTFTTKTESKCLSFFKIKYNNLLYKPEEFNKIMIEKGINPIDEIKTCIINYRDIEKKYIDYKNEYLMIGNKLKQTNNYYNNQLTVYFKGPKTALIFNFFEKIEDCLNDARMSLSNVLNIFPNKLNDKYIVSFYNRCSNFEYTCLHIYSCFEYMLVLIYFHYKFDDLILGKNTFDDMLFKARNSSVNDILDKKPITSEKIALKELINSLEINTTKIRNWTNSIKHKCGLDYYGKTPKTPFHVYMDIKGKTIDTTTIMQLPKVDIDKDCKELINAYQNTYDSIQKLYNILIDIYDINQ